VGSIDANDNSVSVRVMLEGQAGGVFLKIHVDRIVGPPFQKDDRQTSECFLSRGHSVYTHYAEE
jgi:hypothetical protein